jgi:hypothetical protein
MASDNPLVQQATARSAQQDANSAYMASLYGGRGAFGGIGGGGYADGSYGYDLRYHDK